MLATLRRRAASLTSTSDETVQQLLRVAPTGMPSMLVISLRRPILYGWCRSRRRLRSAAVAALRARIDNSLACVALSQAGGLRGCAWRRRQRMPTQDGMGGPISHGSFRSLVRRSARLCFHTAASSAGGVVSAVPVHNILPCLHIMSVCVLFVLVSDASVAGSSVLVGARRAGGRAGRRSRHIRVTPSFSSATSTLDRRPRP